MEARPLNGTLTVMEAHAERSECAFALDEPLLLAVAHSAPDGRSPDATSVRVFVVAPGEGVVLPPGTWHAAGAPLAERPVRYLFLLSQPPPSEVNSGWVRFDGGTEVAIKVSDL